MSAPTPASTQGFLETLYSGCGDGWLVLSHPDPARLTPQGKPALRSDWFALARCSLGQIARAAARLGQQYSLYFGVALQHPSCTPHPWRRSKASTAYVVPGLWFDLDLAYGQHAASPLPQTDAEALGFLDSLPTRPSLIMHSSGGLYGWWIFKEPYAITSEDDRTAIASLSKRFTATVVERGKANGWTLDALGDLARVLRPPGTINHKYGRAVTLLYDGPERYIPEDFASWILDLSQRAPRRAILRPLSSRGTFDILRVAAHYGAELGQKSQHEITGAHPVHGSSTGCNFSVNGEKGVWHCFRHASGGGALELIAVCEGMLACEETAPGCLRGERFRRVAEIANDRFQAGIVLANRTDTSPRGADAPWHTRARPWTGTLRTVAAEEASRWLTR